ncbi:helicase HerA-like domain-containing protein [Dyella sp.]|jgi:DNA helicase HerA-like ATPase|uniref:helicase HerA-like domain-containing protein n=1 Tax=Dyella sp. TaxID=1869338 RepID=UPI002D79527F|nr:helicase HerA-like domain-containing protein [Dyella sp.]HET6432603.1 helicase HerA-like domain-containing protein [Dyella sp.]
MSDILIGCNDDVRVSLDPRYGNRHGMIAGATGTGKSVSLMVLAEGFSRLGVPCFLADAKGDLAGLAMAAGEPGETLKARLARLRLTDWKPQANPVVFWDIYGKLGHPVRATISEMGPTLLGRVLELNDTQQGVLEVVFKVADDQGLLLLDLADLRSMLGFASENAKTISAQYGLISPQSIAAIQRALLKLEQDGADQFFGEPALDLVDLMRQDMSGRGVINVLAADQLIMKPRLYSTFLLWLLSELFEQLPEVGDLDQPKLVFFFDEAHLLFDDCPPALRQRVEQVVRLIRSKGVGVYFCSQNPDDVPGEILGQLGNRVQHALRAFTPRDQKAVKAAAETFVVNPKLDVVTAITRLAVGEALASTLGAGGVPAPVQQVLVTAPCCRIGAITSEERHVVRMRSPVGGKYDTAINRESAAEKLAARAQEKAADAERVATSAPSTAGTPGSAWGGAVHDALFGTKRRQGMIEAMGKSAVRTVGSQLGRQILRGVLGGIFGGRR